MTTIAAYLIDSYGGGEKVYLGSVPKPSIKNDTDILVKVKVGVVNPADLLYIGGVYNIKVESFPAQVGFEGSGVVEVAGKSSGYKVGQRVHYTGLGTWSEYVVIDTAKGRTVPLPDEISFEEGAQLTINPITALSMILTLGAKKGEYLIQTGASSSLARIVILLAKAKGIKTINIVRRDEHIAGLKEIGADYVINSEKEDVVAKVNEIVPGGAQYAVDAVAGKLGAEVAKALAIKGVMLVYGLLSGFTIELDLISLLFKSVAVRGFYVYQWYDDSKKEEVKAAYDEIKAAIISRQLPLVYKAFDAKTQGAEAIKHSQTPGKSEKSILLF